jgi:hypothetical protein
MYIWDEAGADLPPHGRVFFRGCSPQRAEAVLASGTADQTARGNKLWSRTHTDLALEHNSRGAQAAHYIIEVIAGECPGVTAQHVRSALSLSGAGEEIDLAVRYAPEQKEAVRKSLERLGCLRQTRDAEDRLVQFGVLHHEGHLFFVHAYISQL